MHEATTVWDVHDPKEVTGVRFATDVDLAERIALQSYLCVVAAGQPVEDRPKLQDGTELSVVRYASGWLVLRDRHAFARAECFVAVPSNQPKQPRTDQMRATFQLTEDDLRKAVAAYVRAMRSVDVDPADVSFHASSGDRPGDRPTVTASATEAEPSPQR